MIRINKAIELLNANEPIYYMGAHSGHVLTYDQGLKDSQTWADYINIGMEHGCFDMTGLDNYIKGLIDGGPTKSGHRTPALIVELPAEGISEDLIRFNGWQIRQILARGVHGILLCQAETPEAVKAFVEICRYPRNSIGVGDVLGIGTRGVGSEITASKVWGIENNEYIQFADPWPLNPKGELLLGLKIESVKGLERCEEILRVPGIGFAEMGPGDMSMSMGIVREAEGGIPDQDPRIIEARNRVNSACKENGIAFLGHGTKDGIDKMIDTGARVISGADEEIAELGRRYTNSQMK
ncbi:MAG: hypothetical protein CL764_06795 [Chloroflexi bacterium]|nr:hypothetical protein [Chloroflexota bacterium]